MAWAALCGRGPASATLWRADSSSGGAEECPSLSLANIYSRSTMSFTNWKDKEREEPSPSCTAGPSSCSEPPACAVESAVLGVRLGPARPCCPCPTCPSSGTCFTLLSSPPSKSQPPETRPPGVKPGSAAWGEFSNHLGLSLLACKMGLVVTLCSEVCCTDEIREDLLREQSRVPTEGPRKLLVVRWGSTSTRQRSKGRRVLGEAGRVSPGTGFLPVPTFHLRDCLRFRDQNF